MRVAGRLIVRITGSTPSESIFGQARGASYSVAVEDDVSRNTAYELAVAHHRFSEFRVLHARIAAPLSLPPFPASRRLFNGKAVRREREELLPVFLNDALREAARLTAGSGGATAETDAAVEALLRFLGLNAAQALSASTA